jgi:D-sedoheptulose 7-phosphate isomerase
MSVVVLSGGEPGPWPEALTDTDVWIPVAALRGARVREVHLLALHAWCDAIDLQLLGEATP